MGKAFCMRGMIVFCVCMMMMCFLSGACASAESVAVKRYTVSVLKTLPHNPRSFTQGLVFYEGALYESTGLYGGSSLQKIDAQTGEVLRTLPVSGVFAEGVTRWHTRLIQLTWKSGLAFIYALSDFSSLGIFRYDTEGWGLTADAHSLIMSDGTDMLVFRDPHTFRAERTLYVTLEGAPLDRLNELEYIHGYIYANVWHENFIVQIDPQEGNVVGVIDATPLLKLLPPLDHESVLNGIAFHEQAQTFFVTGKRWPYIFEIRLIKQL